MALGAEDVPEEEWLPQLFPDPTPAMQPPLAAAPPDVIRSATARIESDQLRSCAARLSRGPDSCHPQQAYGSRWVGDPDPLVFF